MVLSAMLKIHNFLAAITAISVSIVGMSSSPLYSIVEDGLADSMSISVVCFTWAINDSEEEKIKWNEKKKTKKLRAKKRRLRKRKWFHCTKNNIYRRQLT